MNQQNPKKPAAPRNPQTQQGAKDGKPTSPATTTVVEEKEPPTKPIPVQSDAGTKATLNEGAAVIRTAAGKAQSDSVDNLEDIQQIVRIHRNLAEEFETTGRVSEQQLANYKAIITLLQKYIDGEILSIKNNLIALEKRILAVDENSFARDQILAKAVVATNNRIGKTPVGSTLGIIVAVGLIAGVITFVASTNIWLALAIGGVFGLAAGGVFLLVHARNKESDAEEAQHQMQQSFNNMSAITVGSQSTAAGSADSPK